MGGDGEPIVAIVDSDRFDVSADMLIRLSSVDTRYGVPSFLTKVGRKIFGRLDIPVPMPFLTLSSVA